METPGTDTPDVDTKPVVTPTAAPTVEPTPTATPEVFDVSLANYSVASWGNKATVTELEDGSVKLDWADDATDYTGVTFRFNGIDLSDYEVAVIDAEGATMNVGLLDATRKEPAWGNPLSIDYYGKQLPLKIDLTSPSYGYGAVSKDADENPADLTNLGGVSIYKGTEKVAHSVIVKSIKFYKNAEDVPAE